MKKTILLLAAFLVYQTSFGQTSGNVNYQNSSNVHYQNMMKYPEQSIHVSPPSSSDVTITVKGMANIKADTYVAIFNVTQAGKSAEEVNELIDKRISQALTEIKLKKGVETFVDMISFVPSYEFETDKKIFSKKSYNEIPKGFELKKNIHIKYTDASLLNEFISILSKEEIYDLVKVDYFSGSLEAVKKDLANKAKIHVQEKVKVMILCWESYLPMLRSASAMATK